MIEDLKQAAEKALAALDHAVRVLDAVYLDVMLVDGMPAPGLIDSRKNGRDSVERLRAALAAVESSREPVYQIARASGPAATAWIDVDEAGYHSARLAPEDFKSRKLYAAPAAPVVPPGWKLVPVEPTPEMLEAGLRRKAEVRWADGVNPLRARTANLRPAHDVAALQWAAMLAAAPQAAQPAGEQR